MQHAHFYAFLQFARVVSRYTDVHQYNSVFKILKQYALVQHATCTYTDVRQYNSVFEIRKQYTLIQLARVTYCRYTDVHQYNSVFKMLVKLEADYDRATKESQV
jgi:hypothetical protein